VNEINYQVQVRANQGWQTVETATGITLAKMIARDLRSSGNPVRVWYDGEVVWSTIDGDGYRYR